MTINIFEGARRIVFMIQVLWMLGVIAVTWVGEPYVNVDFEIPQITATPQRAVVNPTCTRPDERTMLFRRTPRGTQVSVELCFRATNFNGQMLIPYKVEHDGTVWGNGRYLEDVRRYIDGYKERFRLTNEVEDWADSQWWKERWGQVRNGAALLAGGWVAIWIIASVIGWIVRGFMKVTAGEDSRSGERL